MSTHHMGTGATERRDRGDEGGHHMLTGILIGIVGTIVLQAIAARWLIRRAWHSGPYFGGE